MIYCDNCYENHLEFKGCPPDCKNCIYVYLIDSLDCDEENYIDEETDINVEGDLIEE